MTTDFKERLDAARKAGKQAVKRDGQTVKALTLQILDESPGIGDPLDLLIGVLVKQDRCPLWLRSSPRHEVHEVLLAWGSVRHAMREHRKAIADGHK